MLALEMRGNNPIVVWDTADIRTAAILVVQSAFLSAGQRCSNARRLIVRDTLADRLIEEVCDLANRLIVDHPHADPAPYMGPVIDNEAADGLTESFLILMSNTSETRRVGKECVSTCSSRCEPYQLKKKLPTITKQ